MKRPCPPGQGRTRLCVSRRFRTRQLPSRFVKISCPEIPVHDLLRTLGRPKLLSGLAPGNVPLKPTYGGGSVTTAVRAKGAQNGVDWFLLLMRVFLIGLIVFCWHSSPSRSIEWSPRLTHDGEDAAGLRGPVPVVCS